MRSVIIRVATALVLGALFLYLFVYSPPLITALSALALLLYIIFFEWPILFDYKKPLFWLILPFYLLLPFGFIIYMCSYYKYRILVFYMVLLTSSQDSGGYIFGSLFGKHKLAPRISPKKSWEGFFGGYLLTLLTLSIILFVENAKMAVPFILIFALIISIVATAGDLFESLLKRRAGIKDTGAILPGHGGFLDRIDSYLAVSFVFFLFKDYLLKVFNI
ncbi:phosphatidate cytidylyltransferase [Candidatus Dependentiae bacterium]